MFEDRAAAALGDEQMEAFIRRFARIVEAYLAAEATVIVDNGERSSSVLEASA